MRCSRHTCVRSRRVVRDALQGTEPVVVEVPVGRVSEPVASDCIMHFTVREGS